MTSFLRQAGSTTARWLTKPSTQLALIFIGAFLVRVLYPVSRPIVWSDRAFHFGLAILEGDWATTYQRYHPGVTIMWLSGLGLHIFSWWQGGFTPDQMLGVAPTPPGTLVQAVQAAMIPVALTLAACVAYVTHLLTGLIDRRAALAAGFFLAFDPFSITYAKVIHPDSLLAMFMLVSAVSFMIYLAENRLRPLLLSGVFGGLALLSKSPALFLFPYLSLIYALWLWRSWHPHKRWTAVLSQTTRHALMWLGVAVLTFVALWPAMWVKPIAVLTRMIQRVNFHTDSVHQNPVFFNGVAGYDDPGIAFYLATIAWKLTFITLPLLVAAIVWALARWQRPRSWFIGLFTVYAIFFTIQMSLGSWKQVPYIAPTFPALSVIVGLGLAELIDWLETMFNRPIAQITMATITIVQLGIIAAIHPYYGTHHNLLLGGTSVAQNILPLQDQGEGLDLAGQYLSTLPYGQDATAVVHPRSAIVFQREFHGRTTSEIIPWANFRVYDVNSRMRGLKAADGWEEIWLKDQQSEPLQIISFDGIPYVWIYGDIPQAHISDNPMQPVDYRFGEHINLTGVQFKEPAVLSPGEQWRLTLQWTADAKITEDYTAFVHITSSGGELVAQQDNVPLYGIRPTETWRPQEVLLDDYGVQMPSDLPAGNYDVWIGMYQSETIDRLPIVANEGGDPLLHDRLFVTSLTVNP